MLAELPGKRQCATAREGQAGVHTGHLSQQLVGAEEVPANHAKQSTTLTPPTPL